MYINWHNMQQSNIHAPITWVDFNLNFNFKLLIYQPISAQSENYQININ